MSELYTLRQSILMETDQLGTKKRFGLFSHPITTAVGDDGPYRQKLHLRNYQGKPVTQPRNLYSSPPRSGQLKSSYLGGLNSLAASEIKDEFIEESHRLQKYRHKQYKKGRKYTDFVPATSVKQSYNSTYKYQEETNPYLNPRRFRSKYDGRVVSRPRNVFTNLQSTVVTTFFKPWKHIDDPYERARQLEIEIMKQAKTMEKESAFRPNSFYPKVFNKDKLIYGNDTQQPKTERSKLTFNIYPHESPWRPSHPSKKGYNGPLSPFPVYIENAPLVKGISKGKKYVKDPFKKMSTSFTVPCPTILLNKKNMMRHLNRSLSHHI